MNFFYCPVIFEAGQFLELPEDELHHAIRVLRVSNGEKILLINGLGQKAEGLVQFENQKFFRVHINTVQTQSPLPYRHEIALAILKKKDRIEWFVEKAVELAANKIFLFASAHTEKTRLDEKRIYKIAVSALKQSGNLWMPEISFNHSFNEIVTEDFEGMKLIAHCEEDEEKQLLKTAYQAGKNARILIGPEGDFSSKEIKTALENKYLPVSLGALRLRAETAALSALLTLNLANQC